jgi:hypothetical protein
VVSGEWQKLALPELLPLTTYHSPLTKGCDVITRPRERPARGRCIGEFRKLVAGIAMVQLGQQS